MELKKLHTDGTDGSNSLTVGELLDRITALSHEMSYFNNFKADLIEILNSANVVDDGIKRQIIEMVEEVYNNRESTIQQTLSLYEKMFDAISKSEPSK